MSTEPTEWPDGEHERAAAERIKWFIETFGPRELRYVDELVPIMRRNDLNESFITCHEMPLNDGFRKIYRNRAKHLKESRPSPYYPPGLADDVGALASQLEEARDQKLRIWSTTLANGISYLVFELVEDAEIAGCVKTADQRIVNPSA